MYEITLGESAGLVNPPLACFEAAPQAMAAWP
jgi:hypothetical protein